MELYFAGLSDQGNVRDNNEDFYFAGRVGDDEYLFIVADGMGGHQAGELASKKAVTEFVEKVKQGIGPETARELENIVLAINDSLMQEGSRLPGTNGMGTTLSALYIKGESGFIVHVGDSRIYRYSGRDMVRLTEDHSFVGKLLRDGVISEDEAQTHSRRNVLYQALGLKKDIDIQSIDRIPIKKDYRYLLCSDGLHGVVPDRELERYFGIRSTAAMVEELVKKAKENGGPDNITVVAVAGEKDEALALIDTVKLMVPDFNRKKKKKTWTWVLFGLLILLLGVLIYIMAIDVADKPGAHIDRVPIPEEK